MVWIGSLILLAVTIHVYSLDAARVENGYSTGIYPPIAVFLRNMLGWLPVSIGDIGYGLVFIYILWKLFTACRALILNRLTVNRMALFFLRGLIKLMVIYILFNALWGINYNRQGIAGQIGLKMDKYTVDDVKTLNTILVKKVNDSKSILISQGKGILTSKEIFQHAALAYRQVEKIHPFLQYQPVSMKSSLWGWLGNYLGFMGYYNPFTGEAQVNTTIPRFVQPYTTCHEIAHQLGYAKENEANFVGYLAASASREPAFQYSVYLDLFLYAGRNLYKADSVAARGFVAQLLPEVKKDLKDWKDFHERHKNPAEPVVRWIYGIYLENNEQPSGILTYDHVTAFMIAYYKKFGKL